MRGNVGLVVPILTAYVLDTLHYLLSHTCLSSLRTRWKLCTLPGKGEEVEKNPGEERDEVKSEEEMETPQEWEEAGDGKDKEKAGRDDDKEKENEEEETEL